MPPFIQPTEHDFDDPKYRLKVLAKTPMQQARYIKMREMLTPGLETGTPRFTSEEIVKAVSKFDPSWTEELFVKGYTDKEIWKRKLIAVHHTCNDMKRNGLASGFLSKTARRAFVEIRRVDIDKTSKGRILLWFRNIDRVKTLTWADREEILGNMNSVKPYVDEAAKTEEQKNL